MNGNIERFYQVKLNGLTSRLTIINSQVINLSRDKIKLNVLRDIIYCLVEVSFSKDVGGKVKVSCNVIDDRILTDYDLSLTEKELTEIINTSW
ncbi:MAG: hypothetical protein HND40_03540 [Ignavibacteriota bacterium]|nr:hypothetical protein [Ignavibacteriales bacterium]MCZ2268658.1 hypothetical protein [Ignavibacteriales bacterium]QKJ98702.1 MAG: hypothetical protein HND40_03540 [Ignavibacteriota bacterium]